jgi:hypothetical protein
MAERGLGIEEGEPGEGGTARRGVRAAGGGARRILGRLPGALAAAALAAAAAGAIAAWARAGWPLP